MNSVQLLKKKKSDPVFFFFSSTKSFKFSKFKFIAPIVLCIFVKATVMLEQHAVLRKAI